MKYYQNLAPLSVFSLKEAVEAIGNEANAKSYLTTICRKGLIRRVKKNLYSVVNPVNGEDTSSHFVIASHITENSFISFRSAFEFYGFSKEPLRKVQVSSTKRFLDFDYEGRRYHCVWISNLKQVDLIEGAKVTSLERTIVDSVNSLGRELNTKELLEHLFLIGHVDEKRLKEMLLEYDKDILFRKVGYVLSHFKEQIGLSDGFFSFCKEHSNVANYGPLSYEELESLEFVSEWGLYAYKDLSGLL